MKELLAADMAVFDLLKPVLPKAPLLLGNAIVFLLAYFSIKADTLVSPNSLDATSDKSILTTLHCNP